MDDFYQKIAGHDHPEGREKQTEDLSPCYAVLQVGSDATMEEINATYEKLMRAWHEDNYRDVPLWKETAQEKRRGIKEAYEKILSLGPYAKERITREGTDPHPSSPAFLSADSAGAENFKDMGNLERSDAVQDDRLAEPSAGRNVRRLLIGTALAAVTALALLYWPSLYHYDSITTRDKAFPLRINRLTGATTYFNGHEWLRPPIQDQTASKEKEQPKQVLPPVIPESVKTTSASSEPVERKAPASLEDERRKRNETKTYHGVAVASKEMSTGKADLRLSKSAPAAPSEPRQPQKSSIRSAGKIGKDGIYSIQIRAFQDEAKANAFLREVKGDKRSIRIQKTVQEDHKIWYRVLIGRFKNRNEALGYLKKKKIQEAYPGSFIQHAGKTEMKI